MKNGRNVKSWLAAAMMAALAGSVWAQQMAPVNPAFARWQREQAAKEAEGKKGSETARPRAARAAAARGEAGGEDMDFGFVPTVLDMGYLSNLNDNLAQGVGDVLEPAYDLREAGALTAVRDQGSYGNCWAFAAMGSLESWVKKSEGTELDLSENHLVNLHGWSQGFGAGGNAQMAEGYFLRWEGPVAESEDAYPRPGKSVAGTPVRHVQRVRWIPGKTAYLDNDGIKQALKSWGALQADYYHAGSYYNAKTAAYYFNPGTSYRLSNHAVDLVGWDDNYSKKNFKPEPPGDGAYIVRNSWGSGWGEGGYFHISYYDESFAWKPLYSFSGTEAADNYDAVYQHDPLGMVGAIGYAGPTAWGANVFTAAEASKVAAAGFYAMTPRTTYTLMVYTGCRAGSPRSGTLAAQQSGTVDAAGYVTVPLETPAAVSAGQRFSVVVQLTTPGYAYPLAVEYAVAGYSAAASAKEGESYLSANGSKWDDFTARVASTANFCCKAYVKSAAVVRLLAGLSIEGVNSLKAGSSADFSCTATYSDGSTKTVTPRWSIVEGGKWASVDSSGRVTAKATGEQRTVKLRASYSEGGVSKTAEWRFFVTVAAPAAPADLEATAGTEESCVRLSWTASEGAAGYAVYRGTRESSGNAAYLGTVTATRYADTAAVPGVDYRYFVKAKNGSGSSPFSAGAWGWRALAAPANLSASDGTRDDRVDVAWNRSEGASHYRVWRADGEDGEPVAVSPWQTACQYADTTAEAGMPHLYYATAAVDAEGTRESAFGVPDEGFRTGPPMLKTLEISGPVSLVSGGRGTYTCTAVSTDGTRTTVAPEWTLSGGSLAVSDGKAVVTAPVAGENTTVTLTAAYSDGTANRTGRLAITVTPAVPPAPAALELVSATERGIALRWSAVANATSYQLWRSGPGEDSAVVASTTATEHTDASAAPGVAYAYRVGAANAAGAGAPGGTVVEAVRPVAAPTGVSASYGTYADKVAVSWKACEGAEFYRVWRADSADGAKTALGAWQTALAFDDTTATAGTVHYYSVQAAVDETGTAASAFGGPAVGLRKISPKPVALTILGPDRVAAESTAAYTAKVRYENGAVASVVPVWSIASGGTFATIGADGLLTVGKLEEDRTIVVTARFIDGATVEGSLEVALVAPIVKTATVKDVEAHARWPWNGWVDVDYTLETAPTGTFAKISLSGYDNDHKSALAATTLSGDGARGARVAPGKRRISWNLGADYPDFHASRIRVILDAIPTDSIDPNLQNGGLAAAFFDLNSTAKPYSTWNSSCNAMREFFAARSPVILTNTVYAGENFAFGGTEPKYVSQYGACVFPGKYALSSADNFVALFTGKIDIPMNGTYRFEALSDNGYALYIDQQLVYGVSQMVNFSSGRQGASVALSAGLHDIAIAFHAETSEQGLLVYWQPPTATEITLLPQSILYYTDPSAECFTVRFSANGGMGSMSDWMCNPNFAAMLPANTFKRSGFTFAGWATSTSGAVEFTDGQDVTGWDVAAGETVTLYAVWKEIEAGELPTKGLVAYYPFNGNLNDESGNGYHLTNEGGILAADRFGNAKRALSFDGQKHRAYPESFRRTNSFSVACWFKTDVTKASYGSGSTAWNEGNYVFFPNHGGNNAGVGFKVGTDGIEVVEHGSCYMPTKLQYNAQIGSGWNHVCMVVQNNTGVRIYLNGKSVDSATLSSLEKYCGIHIGGDTWGYYTGLVDELCVYDRVLSDDEVDQVYRAGLADDSPVAPAGLSDGLVAYWPFDGDARDASGNGNDGTVNGATLTSDRNGKAKGAYYFGGHYSDGFKDVGYIEVPNSDSLYGVRQTLTVAAWIRIDQWIENDGYGGNRHASVLCKGYRTRQYSLQLEANNEKRWIVRDYCQMAPVEAVPSSGSWHHVAVTDDGNRMTAYLDGVAVASKESCSDLAMTTESLYIGMDRPGGLEYFNGAMDDVAVWNRALSAAEVARLYAGEKPVAKYLVVDLSGGPSAESWPVEYLDGEPAGGFNTDEYKTTKLVLRQIDPGTFMMGSPTGELGRATNETQHEVTLTNPYWMGVFQVTQKQWTLAMGSNPSEFSGDTRPVEHVSYDMIRGTEKGAEWPGSADVDDGSFLAALRSKTGLSFDLPTEAQWEYACRAGTMTALNSGQNLSGTGACTNLAVLGKYGYNSGYRGGSDNAGGYNYAHTAVGCYLPNAWGLYDMHGNVWEWCLDWFGSYGTGNAEDPKGATSGSKKVVRGGSWWDVSRECRSAWRGVTYSNHIAYNHGFRLVCAGGE